MTSITPVGCNAVATFQAHVPGFASLGAVHSALPSTSASGARFGASVAEQASSLEAAVEVFNKASAYAPNWPDNCVMQLSVFPPCDGEHSSVNTSWSASVNSCGDSASVAVSWRSWGPATAHCASTACSLGMASAAHVSNDASADPGLVGGTAGSAPGFMAGGSSVTVAQIHWQAF